MIYIIYKISIVGNDYIGSTKDLKQRKATHKSSCTNKNNSRYNNILYKTIRDNGGWDYCIITAIEEFDCETKRQAECREEYWRREYNACLNMKRAFITKEEEKEQRKIFAKKAQKKYNEKIKNEIATECECGIKCKLKYKKDHFLSKYHQEFINRELQ